MTNKSIQEEPTNKLYSFTRNQMLQSKDVFELSECVELAELLFEKKTIDKDSYNSLIHTSNEQLKVFERPSTKEGFKEYLFSFLKFKNKFQIDERVRYHQAYHEAGGIFSWSGATDEIIYEKFLEQNEHLASIENLLKNK